MIGLCRISAVLAAALLTSSPLVANGAAQAAEVTLRMKGGGLEIRGELKSFDGVAYTIEAPQLGTMTFDAARVECAGDACARRVAAALAVERLDPATPETFTVAGSGPVVPALMPALIRAYAASLGGTTTMIVGTTPGEHRYRLANAKGAELATIVLHQGGAGAAFDALAHGSAAIAFTERRIGEGEIQQIAAAVPEFRIDKHEQAIAIDALAVVVSPHNRLQSISGDALAKVVSGQIAHWVDLGVSGGRIALYASDRTAGALSVLDGVLLQPRNLAITPHVTEVATEAEVADRVASDPDAIGIVSLALQRNSRSLNLAGACGLITRPTPFAVKAGEYPLARQLYAYTAGPIERPAARGLLRFAVSPAAQALIREALLVDQGDETAAAEDEKGRLAAAVNAPAQAFDMELMRRLLAETKAARRLSITFRFAPGTVDLDASSRLAVSRLASLLQTPELADRKAILIGYTDATGQLSNNVQASLKRAQQVRTAVLKASGGRIGEQRVSASGYGPLAPVACSDTADSRQLNRRVEVWIGERP